MKYDLRFIGRFRCYYFDVLANTRILHTACTNAGLRVRTNMLTGTVV